MPLRAVIKAGGSKGVDRDAVANLVADVARSDEIVLVHGASGETDRLANPLCHPPDKIVSPSGHQRRRTHRRTLRIFSMGALGGGELHYLDKVQQRGDDALRVSRR